MPSLLWKSLVVSPTVFGATLLVSVAAMATQNPTKLEGQIIETTEVASTSQQEATKSGSRWENSPNTGVLAQTEVNTLDQINPYSQETTDDSQSQVTSVSQFTDVQPTDWAFQALQSLVERYGCIAGYPNETYRGNRALTRYEFAAGLSACLDRVNELIATATADVVRKDDLVTLQRLQEEFSAELSILRGRVDALEAKSAELEANQFSTTTKLVGEAIFALSDVFGGNADNNTVFQDRIRLNFQTSFTGKDLLNTRLATGNAQTFDFGIPPENGGITFEGTQTFNLTGDTSNTNSVFVDWLAYYFPVGPAQFYVAGFAGIHSDYAPTVSPFFEDFDNGNGALSTFASESPIYRIGGGAGAAVNLNFGKGSFFKPSSITLGYLASQADSPGDDTGLFNGNYAALGQVNFNFGDRAALAATYVRGYHNAGSALFDAGRFLGSFTDASGATRDLGVVGTAQANTILNPSTSNSYGLAAAIKPSQRLSINGFVSYHDISGTGDNDDFDAWSYGVGLALPDLGKQGNLLGLFAGAEPYSRNREGFSGDDTPYHVEGFYRYRVNDNISITPGVIWLTAPGQDSENDDAFIGTLRTTFTF